MRIPGIFSTDTIPSLQLHEPANISMTLLYHSYTIAKRLKLRGSLFHPLLTSTWLVQLFSPPRLRTLCLENILRSSLEDDATSLTWPKTTSKSSVIGLLLMGVVAPASSIVRMSDCCQKLERFGYARHIEGCNHEMNTRPGCQENLDGLQRHSESLEYLALDPRDSYLR